MEQFVKSFLKNLMNLSNFHKISVGSLRFELDGGDVVVNLEGANEGGSFYYRLILPNIESAWE